MLDGSHYVGVDPECSRISNGLSSQHWAQTPIPARLGQTHSSEFWKSYGASVGYRGWVYIPNGHYVFKQVALRVVVAVPIPCLCLNDTCDLLHSLAAFTVASTAEIHSDRQGFFFFYHCLIVMLHPNLPSFIVRPICQHNTKRPSNSEIELIPTHLPGWRSHCPPLTMPDEDLPKSLAKAEVEADTERQRIEDKKRRYAEYDRAKTLENWKNWNTALEAYASGWRPPKRRYYIVISPETPISTPEKLQEMAKMNSAPKLVDTTYTGFRGGDPDAAQMGQDGTPQKVRVGEVSWKELEEVMSKTEYNDFLFVWIEGKVRAVCLVESLASGGVSR